MAYAITEELRRYINKADTGDDLILTEILAAAERNINRACNRPDGLVALTTATARRYAGSGKPYQWIDECTEVSTVEVKNSATDTTYDTWTSADYIEFSGDPEDPNFNITPYTGLMVDPTGDESLFTSGAYTVRGGFRPSTDVHRGVPTVRVTAMWGYATTVPADIKTATIMQAARWYKRLEGSMSDALASGELGMLLYQKSLDPDIKRLLVDGRYVRPAVGGRQ
jgi:hypothetical protein